MLKFKWHLVDWVTAPAIENRFGGEFCSCLAKSPAWNQEHHCKTSVAIFAGTMICLAVNKDTAYGPKVMLSESNFSNHTALTCSAGICLDPTCKELMAPLARIMRQPCMALKDNFNNMIQ